MTVVFYISAAVAILATILAISCLNAMHALLYLIVSLLAVAVVFFTLGAAFIAALEVIIYAGAIIVLFVFVVMMLNLGPQSTQRERQWLTPGNWGAPAFLTSVLLAELIYIVITGNAQALESNSIPPTAVGIALLGPYVLGVELASLLLMAGLVGACHLGRAPIPEESN